MRTLLGLSAALFIAAHLPFLPSSLADRDSIDFAFAVRDVDAASGRPHAHGAPHYVGAARGATALLHRAGDPLNVPHALSIVNLTGAALALPALYWLARVLWYSPRRAFAAVLVAGAVPLYWFSASRPLSDFPGLAAALAAQALLARGLLAGDSRHAIAGAIVAGAAMGLRLQTALLTLPLLAVVLWSAAMPRGRRLWIAAGAVAGMLTWVVPSVVEAGAGAYAGALAAQARDTLGATAAGAWIRLLPEALYATFVDPFGSVILASIVLGVAAVGVVLAISRERSVLKIVALGFLPYLAFHLLFQDPFTNRYALPLIPAIALLFVLPIDYVSPRAVLPAAAGAATAGLIIAVPALQAFADAESPGFGVIRDLHRLPRVNETVLAMHHSVASDLERHQAWEPIPPMRTLPPADGYEWLELVKLWQGGYEGPIWFLADPRRTDLRQIDPQRRRLLRQYGWPERDLPFIGGIRPNRIDWYHIDRPGWFLGRGWALSPDVGGLTARDRDGAGQAPALAWIRRRDTAATMLLGGRHLGGASDPPLVVRVRVDGTQVDEWPIRPGPFVFMRPLLPEEITGDGTYARLELDVTWTGSGPAPIALDQFDVQSIDGATVAYAEGWQEPEQDRRSGHTWRWMSGDSTLWLYHPGRDVTLAISGQDPSRWYRRGAVLTVLAGERELARFTLDGHFTRTVTIPAEPLSVARGRVTLRVPDGRRIRIYDVSVH
ncbi:MAG TPA: hypothetical protein VMN81_13085 [Vicinamibacterales bacterium]|nr:hypothetical protein [Vicinamibacterales bacterium]